VLLLNISMVGAPGVWTAYLRTIRRISGAFGLNLLNTSRPDIVFIWMFE
jgi:hypothetical protein